MATVLTKTNKILLELCVCMSLTPRWLLAQIQCLFALCLLFFFLSQFNRRDTKIARYVRLVAKKCAVTFLSDIPNRIRIMGVFPGKIFLLKVTGGMFQGSHSSVCR